MLKKNKSGLRRSLELTQKHPIDVANFVPHPMAKSSVPVIWMLCGHLRPPCRGDVGVNACCALRIASPSGRVRSLHRSCVAICVQPPLSCTSSL